jgi:hypothetical protein
MFTIEVNKIGLSPADDKRWVLDDGINTLAHGHYKITKLKENAKSNHCEGTSSTCPEDI